MYFEQNGIDPLEMMDAKKEKIDREMAWELIQTRPVVYIGKGKKLLSLEPDESHKEEILKSAMGRSGNLRAPAVKTKNAFLSATMTRSMGHWKEVEKSKLKKMPPQDWASILGGHNGLAFGVDLRVS